MKTSSFRFKFLILEKIENKSYDLLYMNMNIKNISNIINYNIMSKLYHNKNLMRKKCLEF